MSNLNTFSDQEAKVLFTPGPLSTSDTVKSAMMRDVGSRDAEFVALVRDIRRKLVALGGASEAEYTAILMQGSGTFGVEAVLSSVIAPDGKLLIVSNGAYGERMARIARVLKLQHTCLRVAEDAALQAADVEAMLRTDDALTHVAVVHCETTTGILNPMEEIGRVAHRLGRTYIVDAMSSFGAMDIALEACGIDYLISSSNKCLQGVPGFSFVLARRDGLAALGDGYSRSLCLDLVAQWKGLESDGQFRFTPPTHTLLAFHQALLELETEGGVPARAARYRSNHETLIQGMRALGFREYLTPDLQSYIITSFHYPRHRSFDFASFYSALSSKGYVIYPGKLTQANCFRIGTIGHITGKHITGLVDAIRATLSEMGVPIPVE